MRSLKDLNDDVIDAIEQFFVTYNELEGRSFTPLDRRGPKHARSIVKESQRRLARSAAASS